MKNLEGLHLGLYGRNIDVILRALLDNGFKRGPCLDDGSWIAKVINANTILVKLDDRGEVVFTKSRFFSNDIRERLFKDLRALKHAIIEVLINKSITKDYQYVEKDNDENVSSFVNACLKSGNQSTMHVNVQKPDGTFSEKPIEVKMKDLLLIVDFLNGMRIEKLEERYTEEAVKRIVGMPRDPFAAETISLLEEELKLAKSKETKELYMLAEKQEQEVKDLKSKWRDYREELVKKIEDLDMRRCKLEVN